MIKTGNRHILNDDIRDITFRRIVWIAQDKYGLNLRCQPEEVVRRRLAGLIRRQMFRSPEDYVHYIAKENYDPIMVDLMSLICEPYFSFDASWGSLIYLVEHGLSRLLMSHPRQKSPFIKLWNAGCFSGEETYSFGLALYEGILRGKCYDFIALGTDGCSTLLEKAPNGFYYQGLLSTIPEEWRQHFFIEHTVGDEQVYEVIPEIRRRVTFSCLNIMGQWNLAGPYDIIVSVNLMHYLVPKARETLIKPFCHYLRPGGLLFTLPDITLTDSICTQIYPGIYLRL